MKNHSLKRVISALLTSLIILSFATLVSAESSANVDFYISETQDGIVELKLSVKNATFMGIQAAVRYNTEALTPVDKDFNPASTFNKFATLNERAEFFNTIGLTLDPAKGIFGFTFYIMPGTEEDGINESNEYVASDKGIELCTFRFKKISNQSFDFEIAAEDDTKPYNAAIPEGLKIINYSTSLEANVMFSHNDNKVTETVIKPLPPAPEVKPITSLERKKDVICLQIGKTIAVANGKKTLIDSDDSLVVPYISGERTLVPLRFIVESLGAEVVWEEGWDGCIVKKDGTEIELTFNSAEFKVNGEKVTYDAPIEITRDRTMVPVRFVSEQLGCHVYWNDLNKAVVISPEDNPWVEDRKAEITALNEMLVTILGII